MPDHQENQNTGEDIVRQQIAAATSGMLPMASGPAYRSAWHDLQDYRTELRLNGPTTIRHVFSFLAKKYADKVWISPGTLWTRYSMLRMMIRIREGSVVDDGATMACETWLKGLTRTHNPKQSLQLTKEQVARFLIANQAKSAIDMHVLLIFGLNLGIRTADLKKLQWRNVTQYADGLRITVDWATKTDQGARGTSYFIAKEQDPRVCGVTLFAEYRRIVQEAEPERLNGDLWLRIIKTKLGKWIVIGPRGRNWITSVPSMVAKALGLPTPELYTGHCYRRTSAQWQADAGATALELQNQFGWKSPAMATVYTGQSTVARSASSRRCLISGELASMEGATRQNEGPNHAYLQEARVPQGGNSAMTQAMPPQSISAIPGASMQWPCNITGQNINIYFGCPPAVGAAAQAAAASSLPLHQNEKDAEEDVHGKEICRGDDSVDIQNDAFSDFESMSMSEMMIFEPEAVQINSESVHLREEPIVEDLVGGASRKRDAKSANIGKRRPKKSKKINAKSKRTEEEELPPVAIHSNAATNSSTTRPHRTQVTTVHNNPYSRNIRGFVPPK